MKKIVLIGCVVLLAGIFSCADGNFGNGVDLAKDIKPASVKSDLAQTGTPDETEVSTFCGNNRNHAGCGHTGYGSHTGCAGNR